MSIEYLPVGVACNLKCEYCYQDPMRDAGNINSAIDWSAAKAQLEKENYHFTVFGGEPLLAPIKHLEEVFKFGYEKFGKNSIQTNGTLITWEHIELFKKYAVSVGISIDGAGKLNDGRRVGTLEETRNSTETVMRNIGLLCMAGIVPSLIVTLNQHNARPERIGDLCYWFVKLETMGIRHINLHILEVENGKENLALTDSENILAFSTIYAWRKTSRIHFEPFDDIEKLLTVEEPSVSCIWNGCDPATTDAVHGVAPDGTLTNCGRTNKDGVNWVKGDRPGFERYLVLHETPQEYGGCKDCRFFVFCKGQCPGTAIDNDWRNRTTHCHVWYELFRVIEEDILKSRRLPISRDTAALKRREASLLRGWSSTSPTASQGHGDSHGDSNHGDSNHGDSHGDNPHGDAHGDAVHARSMGVPVTWLNV